MKRDFTQLLTQWYKANKRELHWRGSKSPYKIWLSEIILQQTQIKQGTPYYLKFVKHYPTINDLAKASEDEVLKLWQGLGYYSRARNMLYTAKYIVYELHGLFPDNYKDLLKLKGIGDYTASIIASICFDEPVPCVDGNVYRFLARYFDLDTPVPSNKALKEFKQIILKHFDHKNPGDFNQALMEFGALHCRPKNPKCGICPFIDGCMALKNETITIRPVKIAKSKPKNRFFNYLVYIDSDNNTLFEQRKGNDIWKGLYQFPLIETEESILSGDKLEVKRQLSEKIKSIEPFYTEPLIHRLTHQKIVAQFWIVRSSELLENTGDRINLDDLRSKATCKLVDLFLKDYAIY